MKILTGNWRGKPIQFKANPFLRPTADKARKAVFDMLQDGVAGKRALDLFAGTGALGFEALSNGADFVTFVEMNKNQATFLENNLKKFEVEKCGEVLVQDALEAIPYLYEKKQIYDLIFIDPPYKQELAVKALELLARLPLWTSGSLIFAECHAKETLPERVGELTQIKSKTYGDTQILVYSVSV